RYIQVHEIDRPNMENGYFDSEWHPGSSEYVRSRKISLQTGHNQSETQSSQDEGNDKMVGLGFEPVFAVWAWLVIWASRWLGFLGAIGQADTMFPVFTLTMVLYSVLYFLCSQWQVFYASCVYCGKATMLPVFTVAWVLCFLCLQWQGDAASCVHSGKVTLLPVFTVASSLFLIKK
ncbi:hypothetical protein MAR_010250, partial [Mya arenaria]